MARSSRPSNLRRGTRRALAVALLLAAPSCNLILGNDEGFLVDGSGGASDPGAAGSAGQGAEAGTGSAGEGGGEGARGGSPDGGEAGDGGSGGESCGGPCALAHAAATCVAGACEITACVGPFRDANSLAADGCETGDVASQDLTLWFMGDRGVTEAAGLVSGWQDQSGSGLHAAQASASRMPRRVDLPTGPDMLEFDGADDGLALPEGFATTNGTSFFAVVEALENAGCAGILSFSNGDDVDDIEFGRHTPNRLYYEVVGQFVEGTPDAFAVGRRFLIDVVQSANGAVELRIDGVRTGGGTINLPAAGVRRQNFVGRDVYDECPTAFHGRIGEILYYRRGVTVAERDRVASYLVEKWAISP